MFARLFILEIVPFEFKETEKSLQLKVYVCSNHFTRCFISFLAIEE